MYPEDPYWWMDPDQKAQRILTDRNMALDFWYIVKELDDALAAYTRGYGLPDKREVVARWERNYFVNVRRIRDEIARRQVDEKIYSSPDWKYDPHWFGKFLAEQPKE